MYGFKEKNKHLKELRNPAAAQADLQLLGAAAPAHPKLRMFRRNLLRHAEDILYTLLDYKSKDEIRIHRREFEKLKEGKEDEVIPDAGSGHTGGEPTPEGNQNPTSETSMQHASDDSAEEHKEGEGNPESGSEVLRAVPAAETNEKIAELEKGKKEAEERADQAEEQADTLELEKQELEEELETQQEATTQAEERADQAERLLEEEKKKENPKSPKGKSTKSTLKSTGKTSKTKTSK